MGEEKAGGIENAAFKDRLAKGLLLLLFIVLFDLVEIVVVMVAVVQYIMLLATGNTMPQLRELGLSLGRYLKEIVAYLTFESDEKPYPFAPWPEK
ncbi:MAG: DUF4389 domain-containing protein [Deltaproteobacteria bacterium]|nr:DUF4389 domain-containing protein [Deltaproteobacteria bacterium]